MKDVFVDVLDRATAEDMERECRARGAGCPHNIGGGCTLDLITAEGWTGHPSECWAVQEWAYECAAEALSPLMD